MSDLEQPPESPESPMPGPGHRRPSNDYPLWFRMTIIAILTLFLGYQLVVKGDTATALMLGGIVGTALGVSEWFRTRGDSR